VYPNYKQVKGQKSDTEIRAAKALVHFNFDTVNNLRELVKKEMLSVIISPAITIVLFQLMLVNSNILSNWQGQEPLAALHTFRKLTLNIFQKSFEEENPDYDELSQFRM
jgi:hypothetical protein